MEKYFGKLIKDYENLLVREGLDGKLKEKLVDHFIDILNVDAVCFILNTYKEEVLDREFGDSDLSNKILSNKIMGELERALIEEPDEKIENNFLDKPIDYTAMFKNIKNEKHLSKVKNVLNILDLSTYQDLQREVYRCFDGQNEGMIDWKNEKEYVNYLSSFRGMGKKSIDLIISHLKKTKFSFSEKSARKAYENSGK